MKRVTAVVVVALAATMVLVRSFGGQADGPATGHRSDRIGRLVVLHGGGASFPDAFYQAANTEFNETVGYEAVTYAKSGSRDGRMQLVAGTLDLAGTDSLPVGTESVPTDLLFFPIAAAPITVAFNLGGIEELSLSAGTIASIFQGGISRWDAPGVATDNPGVELPAAPIHVVHRSDGSGTTLNFTRYLRSAAPQVWSLGSGDEIAWPSESLGAEKNSGVAELIATTPGSIGYVDLGDAAKAGLAVARIENSSGEYVAPTAAAVRAAFESVSPGADLTFDLIDRDAPGAYPITSPTWLLVRSDQPRERARLLRSYLDHLLGPAQEIALEVGFVPLPPGLAAAAVGQIARIGR